jgi:uncharacterized protein
VRNTVRDVAGDPVGDPVGDAAGDAVRDRASGAEDVAGVTAQLGRPVRGVTRVAHRCTCGLPDVVETAPRLDDGTPFPTTYYLTCPRAASAIGTLEASGVMREMSERLAGDAELAAAHRRAHEDYLRRRSALGDVPEIAGVSAGGMPDRVKCLHVLVAHALAAGPGVNLLGDEALAALPAWGAAGPCIVLDGAQVSGADPDSGTGTSTGDGPGTGNGTGDGPGAGRGNGTGDDTGSEVVR